MHIPRPRNLGLFRLPLRCLSALALLSIIDRTDALAESGPGQSRAAVFSDRLPGFDETLAREISGQVQAAGYATEFIDTTVLTNQTLLTAKRYDLLVLPGARSLPMAAAPAIKGYLQEGGDLLALGCRPGSHRSTRSRANGSRGRATRRLSPRSGRNISWRISSAPSLSRWTRPAGEASAQAEYELADTDHGKALHVKVGHFGGWEALTSPALVRPFPPGHTLTCFRAKGGPALASSRSNGGKRTGRAGLRQWI